MKSIIKVVDLCKTFVVNKKQIHVLKNVNLEIEEGEFVSVMGPSGSGKSTLLYNISGMDKCTNGKVYFDENDITDLKEKDMASLRITSMGFVFQQMNLLSNLGILDNIVVAGYLANKKNRKKIRSRGIDLMRRTGIIELSENNITQASGGQLQRTAICRALINKPKIIFGDEPTGALNSKAASEVMDIFGEINNDGTTIMLVTHDVSVAARTDRVVFMLDGKIEGELNLGKYQKGSQKKEREQLLSNWLLDLGW